jgi:hypothetical protein
MIEFLGCGQVPEGLSIDYMLKEHFDPYEFHCVSLRLQRVLMLLSLLYIG